MSFAEIFAAWYPHMILVNIEQHIYKLYPVNQCDWIYHLTEINPCRWAVIGVKNDVLNNEFLTINETYVYRDDNWEKELEESMSN